MRDVINERSLNQNTMSIKAGSLPFLYSSMTLKIRFVLYLTFDTKSNQMPRAFLWQVSKTFGLTYSPLNSAKLNCSIEVTLTKVHIHTTYFEKVTPSTPSIWLKADYLRYDRWDSIEISVKLHFPRTVGTNCYIS